MRIPTLWTCLVLGTFGTTNSSFLFGRRLLRRFLSPENASSVSISEGIAPKVPSSYQQTQATADYDYSEELAKEILDISKKSLAQLEQERWSVLMSNPMFYLMTRPDAKNLSLVSYLVIANYSAISPRSALFAYTNVDYRHKWDSVSINLT